jgi:hypothetical protein
MSDGPLSFEDFSARVGQSFTMRFATEDATGTAELVLTECARSTIPGTPRSFNLLFRAGPDAPREQGLYLLGRDDFEPAPVFLVPVRALPDGVEFHAVFNPIDGG